MAQPIGLRAVAADRPIVTRPDARPPRLVFMTADTIGPRGIRGVPSRLIHPPHWDGSHGPLGDSRREHQFTRPWRSTPAGASRIHRGIPRRPTGDARRPPGRPGPTGPPA